MYSKTYLVLKRINKLSENQSISFNTLVNSFIKFERKPKYKIAPVILSRSLTYLKHNGYITAESQSDIIFSNIEITEKGAEFLEETKYQKYKNFLFYVVIPVISAIIGGLLSSLIR